MILRMQREGEMNKVELMKRITDAGKYCKLRIDADGEITGMLVDEDFPYQPATNTGGRRFIGQYGDEQLMREYERTALDPKG